MVGVIICPVCGFSFTSSDIKVIKKKIVCPMCGCKFNNSEILPSPNKDKDQKFV